MKTQRQKLDQLETLLCVAENALSNAELELDDSLCSPNMKKEIKKLTGNISALISQVESQKANLGKNELPEPKKPTPEDIITIDQVQSVYSGKDGECCCGCIKVCFTCKIIIAPTCCYV